MGLIVLLVALLIAMRLPHGPTGRNPGPAAGDQNGRGRTATNRGPTPADLTQGKQQTYPLPGNQEPFADADLTRVSDLMRRFQVDPAALHHAYRAAWQAAEFRRLTAGNGLAQAAYLAAMNDREKLHLELEFSVTNAAFYSELFGIEVKARPLNGRPELLAPTAESEFVYEYNRRIQGDTEGLRKIAAVLHDHGLEGFPVVLRAAEDLALIRFCEERHAAIEAARLDWMNDPTLSPEARAQFESDLTASRAGIEAFRAVLGASFERITGVEDPALASALHEVVPHVNIHPVQPPPDARERMRLLDR